MTNVKLFTTAATFILAFVMIQPSLVGSREPVEQSAATSLERLTYHTGWIILGDLTTDLKRWASGLDQTVPYLTGSFEIIGKEVDRRKPTLPRVGDRILLKANVSVIILDYAVTGEKRRSEPPYVVTRPLKLSDETGLRLEPGTIVQVQDVKISPRYGQMRVAWARVSTVPK